MKTVFRQNGQYAEMFLLSHPTTEEIATFLRGCEADSFSYAEVGASRDEPPAGYHIDHNRVMLGYESDTWERAQQAIRDWKMFEVDGIELCFPDAPIEEGRNVVPLAKHLGFYSLNACRIVYVIDEADRFGIDDYAADLRQVIASLDAARAGRFWMYDGSELPW